MAASVSKPWNLESFLDSLILELDKAQDTLSVKSLTRRLTYTVGEMNVELSVFPVYEEGKLKFQMARPGEAGGSKLTFQLGSITDRQIRETANEPITRDDIAIDGLEGVDDEVKESLRKVGVHSARDLERLEKRNVNLEKVVQDKSEDGRKVDYTGLANIINKARRRKISPRLAEASSAWGADSVKLVLRGSNFVLPQARDARFPVASVNGQAATVVKADFDALELALPRRHLHAGANAVSVALDPYAVIRFELRVPGDDA
jgi:hypothetical protein